MPEISSPTRVRTARNEEIRLPLGGAFIISNAHGRQLFRVEEDGDIFKAGDVPIGSGGGGPVAAEDVTVSPTVAGASDVQGALEAVAAPVIPWDAYTVDLTNADETALSASFVMADVGRTIVGPGIAAGTTVASVVDGVSAELSQPAVGTGTVTALLDPGVIGAGKLSFQPLSGLPGLGMLLTRNETDDGWLAPAMAAIDGSGNFVYVTVDPTGVAYIQMVRPDGSGIGGLAFDNTSLRLQTLDDSISILLQCYNSTASQWAKVAFNPGTPRVTMSSSDGDSIGVGGGSVDVVTGGQFTVNGTPVP